MDDETRAKLDAAQLEHVRRKREPLEPIDAWIIFLIAILIGPLIGIGIVELIRYLF